MSDVVSVNLSGVENAISRLSGQISTIDGKVDDVSDQVKEVKSDLEKLRHDFLDMVEEQRRASALEQATAELVSVRQEMEKKFGNYSTVRNTMVGILQATDAALVRKATISTVSEELMISTPDYWLAPVLVALAAWINNSRDLAERAIREAVRRDNEHTSLAMALICRRNHRTATCYEWLARYFSTQNAASMDADSMVSYVPNPVKRHGIPMSARPEPPGPAGRSLPLPNAPGSASCPHETMRASCSFSYPRIPRCRGPHIGVPAWRQDSTLTPCVTGMPAAHRPFASAAGVSRNQGALPGAFQISQAPAGPPSIPCL
jgi:outer membrane murein-binding lipoprotein Lpp